MNNEMANLTKKPKAALGLIAQRIGKEQAQKEFFPLVDSLSAANSAVEITDQDKPVAILLSYQNYVALTAKACANKAQPKTKKPNLLGSIAISADLDAASAKIASKLNR